MQNFWEEKALMSLYIFCKIFSFQAHVKQKVFATSGLNFSF